MGRLLVEDENQTDEQQGEPDATPADDLSRRERSTIRFPYGDLGDAEDIARAVSNYGTRAELGSVAGSLNQKTTSGAFRTKVATAVTFGAVTTARGSGELTLTALGKRLTDPQQRDAARVDAFLAVPLYAKVYAEYNGLTLPPDQGLEGYMVEVGVAPKIASRARQAFQRSADQAGFFSAGRNRLLLPPTSRVEPGPANTEQDSGDAGNGDGGEVTKMSEDPLLKGLWAKLPDDGPFPARDRKRWLRTLAVNLDMVYGDVEEDVLPQEAKDDAPAGV
jgi:hypothetical protein